jgi:hypothetical protein
MAKLSRSDSTPKPTKNQGKFLVKASVYARLKSLTAFDTLIFQRMADNKYPGALKSLEDWDAFRAEYQNSGSTK